jgi:uncharacterized phage protein (TIGR02218 family)
MKRLSPQLQNCLSSKLTTFVYCCYLKLLNGKELGFTDHAENLLINGITYIANNSFQATTIENSANLAVDNLEITATIDSVLLTQQDIICGMYDHAYLEIFIINYQALNTGKILLKSGYIGEVKSQGEQFTAEIRGLSQKLNINLNQLYAPTCRTNLGSKYCKVNLATYQTKGTIFKVITNNKFLATGLNPTIGWYNYGLIRFISGLNQNFSMEIKESFESELILMLDMPYEIKAADEFIITAGCDKQFTTCCNKYNNSINFRGEPHLPGIDEILKTSGTFK